MTWVIGATSIFGYSLAISDVQVTCLNSGSSADILQKTFPVGNYIAAGFAGDVATGLSLIHNLSSCLNPPDFRDDEFWDLRVVVEKWRGVAKYAYQEWSTRHPTGETHILLVGTRETGTVDVRSLGGTTGTVAVLRSPDFIPEIQDGGGKVASIGSGSNFDIYKEALDYIIRDPEFVYAKGEVGFPGGHGHRIASTIQMVARKNPLPGVSSHFHTTLVGLGSVQQFNSSGMPRVATDWTTLLQLLGPDMDSSALVARTPLAAE